MKVFYVLPVAIIIGGAGLFYRPGQRSTKHPHSSKTPATQTAPKGISLGTGTVAVSHSYPLIPPTRVPVRYIYVIAGQHVRKGEVLAKFENHTYVVARAAGIITEPAADPEAPITDSFPRLWLTETAPFRLQLPLTAANVSLCPGQQVRVTVALHPDQSATGQVSTVEVEGRQLLISLRLQTLGAAPLAAGTTVRVEALPPTI